MASFKAFVYVYIFGGLTFMPLLLAAIFIFVYYTLPEYRPLQQEAKRRLDDPANLLRAGDRSRKNSSSTDDGDLKGGNTIVNEKMATVLKTATDELVEKFHRKHDSDVAAGYFAVCREYVPGGVNGKPPDKLSPAGEVVATESPSVYQTMYRSIFDRTQKPTIEPNKDVTGKSTKKANNVFYVVLRHGHLMLYDDIQQLEVRYVISLEYHDVDVYAGGEEIPEAELWIKRNAIRLKRKSTPSSEKAVSLPFFLFSENLSEKEDFYFAILKNQQKTIGDNAPVAQSFETAHIITLVQRLHSSEEHLQTRWLNALLGRWFLAVYKTQWIEDLIRQKLTKKIARVKKPNFLTKLALQKIDFGTGAPFITNPRLKDLTVDGECTAEMDVNYSGSFRIEIAATVRIDLGARLKAREVDLIMAATCKRLEGHVLVRFKPPPSNRLWFTFEKQPKMELVLEPIVSSRQITYTWILRALENRIMEVVAETAVLPFWDDLPFLDTQDERFRGGIWKKEAIATPSTEIKDEVAEDEAEAGADGIRTPEPTSKDERILSMPILGRTKSQSSLSPGKHSQTHTHGHNGARSSSSSIREVLHNSGSGSKTPERQQNRRETQPRILRSPSFASVADPMISPSHAPADTPTIDSTTTNRRDSILKDISMRSLGTPPDSIAGSPPTDASYHTGESGRTRGMSESSNATITAGTIAGNGAAASLSRAASVGSAATLQDSSTPSDTSTTDEAEGRKSSQAEDPNSKPQGLVASAKAFGKKDHQQAIASVNAAAQAAQKWGWGVLARNRQKDSDPKPATEHQLAATVNNNNNANHVDTSKPMGRGQPLPPPGTPLPKPNKPGLLSSLPKRRDVPLLSSGSSYGAMPNPRTPSIVQPSPRSSRTQSIAESTISVYNGPPETDVSTTASASTPALGLRSTTSSRGTSPSKQPSQRSMQPPALPERKRRPSAIRAAERSYRRDEEEEDELLVVEAPSADSEPASPGPRPSSSQSAGSTGAVAGADLGASMDKGTVTATATSADAGAGANTGPSGNVSPNVNANANANANEKSRTSSDEHHDDFFGHGEDIDVNAGGHANANTGAPTNVHANTNMSLDVDAERREWARERERGRVDRAEIAPPLPTRQ